MSTELSTKAINELNKLFGGEDMWDTDDYFNPKTKKNQPMIKTSMNKKIAKKIFGVSITEDTPLSILAQGQKLLIKYEEDSDDGELIEKKIDVPTELQNTFKYLSTSVEEKKVDHTLAINAYDQLDVLFPEDNSWKLLRLRRKNMLEQISIQLNDIEKVNKVFKINADTDSSAYLSWNRKDDVLHLSYTVDDDDKSKIIKIDEDVQAIYDWLSTNPKYEDCPPTSGPI